MKNTRKLVLAAVLLVCGASIAGAALDPYSFAPENYKPDQQVFRKAPQLIAVAPQRPLVVTTKDGTRMYVTSAGKIQLTVDKAGNIKYSIKGRKSHVRNKKGELVKSWDWQKGSDRVIVRNETGKKIGSEQYGKGGRIVAEYDENGNLTKSYKYNEFGKNMQWVVDELTQTKVRYDNSGRAVYDVDFEGNIIARYSYDEDGFLKYKEDVYKNRTYFDRDGNMTETVNEKGRTITTYAYQKDEKGFYTLASVKDEIKQQITLYDDNGRQTKVINSNQVTIKTFKWEGSTLIYSEDLVNQVITWYENGRTTYATHHGDLVKEWIYSDGKLIGLWDEITQKITLYSHGRPTMELPLQGLPDMQEIFSIFRSYGLEI